MSTQVDFYLLESSDESSRMKTLCRLAEKVQRMGHDIQVLTTDAEQSQRLDALMWTFSQSSFLPHAVMDMSNQNLIAEQRSQTPVLIHHEELDNPPQVLINLKDAIPQSDDLNRVVEIVNQDEHIKISGRDKYRDYKNQDFSIKTHKLPLS